MNANPTGSNVGMYSVGRDIAEGAWYWHRSIVGAKPHVAAERFPTEHRPGVEAPTGARRIIGYLNRFHRRNGELSVAGSNVANDPYKQSMWNVDPALERQSARVKAAVDWRDLNK